MNLINEEGFSHLHVHTDYASIVERWTHQSSMTEAGLSHAAKNAMKR